MLSQLKRPSGFSVSRFCKTLNLILSYRKQRNSRIREPLRLYFSTREWHGELVGTERDIECKREKNEKMTVRTGVEPKIPWEQ